MTLLDVLIKLGAIGGDLGIDGIIRIGGVKVGGRTARDPDMELSAGMYKIEVGDYQTYTIAINNRSIYVHNGGDKFTPVAPIKRSQIEWYGGDGE